MDSLEPQFIGQKLLRRGFKDWFRYMFRVIEGRPFVIEPLHNDLLSIYDKGLQRVNINVPPRSAKTTWAKYLIAYSWTVNPKCNFIYTSYSQTLLSTIASELANILEHPIYKAMYPIGRFIQEEESTTAVDDFWAEYLKRETGKNEYSSRKIVTAQGGTCLFASIGSQITGFGCGIRNCKGFSGALIIDDANKPADIRHATLRQKVVTYFEETLLSRLNNPHVPIYNIQQRLHVEDLSGVLEEKYNFDCLRKPLLDENGVCQLPSQYTEERIKELQTNDYMFSAQYQQQPYIQGGQVIKRDWFGYYNVNNQYRYVRTLITADTAMKVKQHNDFSVFVVGGITADNKLHILDIMRGKWEAPDLKRVAAELWDKWKFDPLTGMACSGLYVEDKASGTGLIQELQRVGIPIVGLKAESDKLTRIENVLSYIEAHQVMLPDNENYSFNRILLKECEEFTRNDSHLHDDQVDALAYLIQEGLAKTNVSLLDFFL